MLRISYRLTLPYPVYVIFSQYYDYEHIQVVHPDTLGKYRLVEVREEGREVIYDQVWPASPGKRRPVSRVRHRYLAPLTMEFEFLEGKYRGTRVQTLLAPREPNVTLVEETYHIPGLPDWGWLAWLIKPLVMAKVNCVWKEDLDVGVCIDGWPGIPKGLREALDKTPLATNGDVLPENLDAAQIPEGRGRRILNKERPVAVFNAAGKLYGLSDRCPHAGGPLSLGRLTADRQCVECPWHGARFKLATGELASGPGSMGVDVVDLATCQGRHTSRGS